MQQNMLKRFQYQYIFLERNFLWIFEMKVQHRKR